MKQSEYEWQKMDAEEFFILRFFRKRAKFSKRKRRKWKIEGEEIEKSYAKCRFENWKFKPRPKINQSNQPRSSGAPPKSRSSETSNLARWHVRFFLWLARQCASTSMAGYCSQKNSVASSDRDHFRYVPKSCKIFRCKASRSKKVSKILNCTSPATAPKFDRWKACNQI